MQNIRERDSESNANTGIYFEVRTLLYVPAFTQKDFHYVHTGPSIKGPLLGNYHSTPGVHNFSQTQSPLHKREGTKPSLKQRRNKT